MRIVLLFFFVTLQSVSLCFSQTSLFTGRILGLPDSIKTLSLNCESYELLSPSKTVEIELDNEFRFSVNLELTGPTRAFLSLGKIPVTEEFVVTKGDGVDSVVTVSTFDPRIIYFYFSPGDNQVIEVNAMQLKETLTIQGKGAHNSLFMNQDAWAFDAYKDRYLGNYFLSIQYEPQAFKRLVDNRMIKRDQFLDKANREFPLSNHLYNVFKSAIQQEAVVSKITYEQKRNIYLKADTLILPSDYYSFLDSVTYQSYQAHKGIAYFYFLDAYLNKMHTIYHADKDFYAILGQYLHGRLYYEYLAFKLRSDFRAEIYEQFDDSNPFPDLVDLVKDRYKQFEGMLPGYPAPDIVLTTIKGNGDIKLSSFKGKYIYIDMWATWCGPCIQEIPSLKTLEKDYEGKNITFLSLSVDKDKDFGKWQKFIQDYPLTGHQFWLDANSNKVFSKHFNVKQIPRFILLDPELRVVDANAPRPSNEAIRKLFDRLL